MKNIFDSMVRAAVAPLGVAVFCVGCLLSMAGGAWGADVVASGSFFRSSWTGGTNVFQLDPAANSTNIYVTNGPPVSVSGIQSPLAILYDVVADAAPGNTNNGIVRLVFGGSLNDSLFTTGSNLFNVDIVHTGTGRLIGLTNIAVASLGGCSSVRLVQIATTNIGFFNFTNVNYRLVQGKY